MGYCMTKDKLYELFGFSVYPEIPADGTENSHTVPALDTGEGYSFYEVTFKNAVADPFEAIAASTDGESLVATIDDGIYYVAVKGSCYTGKKLF